MNTFNAIISAIIAGLSCVAAPRDAGHLVVVFEKSRGRLESAWLSGRRLADQALE